jgi:7-cyano-7-deazaguanine synthase
MKKAIVLFSGGIDSTVMLAMAMQEQRECYALSFDYGQRHAHELKSAVTLAKYFGVEHRIIKIDPTIFKKSSLVSDIDLPRHRSIDEITQSKIPSTYVPGRNTLFIAYAIGQCEIYDAEEIYFGPNVLDYCAYVDCRPEFVSKYQELINLSTKQAAEGSPPQLVTPLIYMTKLEIVEYGIKVNLPLDLTWSCYDPTPQLLPCGCCDACVIRKNAFNR